jgi:hypothetical protein
MQDVARVLCRKKVLLESLGVLREITLIWVLKMCDGVA